MRDGARALVPGLWHLEIASGLAVAARRGILTSDQVDRSLAVTESLLARWIDTNNDLVSARQTVEIAQTFRLSVYDGVYLDLALRARLPLATLDAELRAAAPKAGVKLIH
jgi:predicted nucleic acid-binding protein